MEKKYSQVKAMLAITRASLQGILRSPSTIMFSLFFPIVLITIFGSIGGGGGGASVDVAMDPKSDSTNPLYSIIQNMDALNIEKGTPAELEDLLKKGRITAFLQIIKQDTAGHKSPYDIHLKTTTASQKDLPVLQAILRDIVSNVEAGANPNATHYASISKEVVGGRPYERIDFLLPGMIGFSLIGAAVFGVAFVFFSLRETLVLKRMFATPIKRTYIILGESLARIIFQMLTVIVLIVFGTVVYHFTLANGFVTFLEMMVMCFLGLVVFMGFGFLISSIAKNQNVIPLYANLFMFPQYFLSGTFFSRAALPGGLQSIIKFLPLSALNDALRKISFEGAHLTACLPQIAILTVWGIVIYVITIKVFRWE
ncbi:MAG: ABC transporter permease [Chitinophagaceae bacterium]